MKNKLVNLLLVLLGAAAIAAALYFKDGFTYFWIIVLAGGVICAFGLFSLVSGGGKQGRVTLNAKYKRKDIMLSRPEYEFLQLLRQVNPSKYEVLPQTALVSVIDKLTNNSYRNELFRVADYCFVDKDTFAPLLLVELNDASHNRPERRQRDEKVNAICQAAGLPLVTFWMKDGNDFAQIRKIVLKSILKK